MMQCLLKGKAHVDAADLCGDTCLHEAVWQQDTEAAQLLTDWGASWTQTNLCGESPLDIAKKIGYLDAPLKSRELSDTKSDTASTGGDS